MLPRAREAVRQLVALLCAARQPMACSSGVRVLWEVNVTREFGFPVVDPRRPSRRISRTYNTSINDQFEPAHEQYRFRSGTGGQAATVLHTVETPRGTRSLNHTSGPA